jgi:hypothetical protein
VERVGVVGFTPAVNGGILALKKDSKESILLTSAPEDVRNSESKLFINLSYTTAKVFK